MIYSRLSLLLKNRKRNQPDNLIGLVTPKEAAVMVLCCIKEGVHHLVLTKRSHTVEHHKGQICFPGGGEDPDDGSLWNTALRETHEEIGVEPALISSIGELGQVITPTGFRITPYIGLLEQPILWTTNPNEIDDVFTVPINHLLDSKNFELVPRTYFGKTYEDPVFTFGKYEIWGATGRIIVDFLEVWKAVS